MSRKQPSGACCDGAKEDVVIPRGKSGERSKRKREKGPIARLVEETVLERVHRQCPDGDGKEERRRESNRKYFLLKSEPSEFGIEDLASKLGQRWLWDGIRNFQARKILQSMQVGDWAFFYHSSNGKETGIVGLVEVVRAAYPDPCQYDPASKYYDPLSCEATGVCRWFDIDVRLVQKWEGVVTLTELKSCLARGTSDVSARGAPGKEKRAKGSELVEEAVELPASFREFKLFKQSRLSVMDVSSDSWEFILDLARVKGILPKAST